VRSARRIVAVLCILAVLVCAVLAPAAGVSAPSILVPLAPLFGFVVLLIVRAGDSTPDYAYLRPGPRPSRAPPAV